jgi:hypothetical protein
MKEVRDMVRDAFLDAQYATVLYHMIDSYNFALGGKADRRFMDGFNQPVVDGNETEIIPLIFAIGIIFIISGFVITLIVIVATTHNKRQQLRWIGVTDRIEIKSSFN